MSRAIRNAAVCGLVVVVATLMGPGVCRAATTFQVAQGWDLFQTDPTGTTFPGLGNLMGVPLGTFDFDNTFGRNIGVQNVGNTDTIIERDSIALGAAPGPSPATIPIAMDALHLETVVPVNFNGNGLDTYFVTLQSE